MCFSTCNQVDGCVCSLSSCRKKANATPGLASVYVDHSCRQLLSCYFTHFQRFRKPISKNYLKYYHFFQKLVKLAPSNTSSNRNRVVVEGPLRTTSITNITNTTSTPSPATNRSNTDTSSCSNNLITSRQNNIIIANCNNNQDWINFNSVVTVGELQDQTAVAYRRRRETSTATNNIPGLMQQSPQILREKLIEAVDDSYHVKDMATIIDVLGTLERLPVTKEMLEITRLGKTVNEFRRRINNAKLAKRAKALVKKWRDTVLLVESQQTELPGPPVNGNSSSSIPGGRPDQGQGSHRLSEPTLGSLQQRHGGLGHNTSSSSPKLTTSSRVSPLSNSSSLSPRVISSLALSNNGRNGSTGSSRNSTQELIHNRNRLAAGATSSPLLNSASLRVSSPASTAHLSNRTKSPYGPTSSIYTQQSTNRSPLLPSSSSYAPNSEIVAKTNAANKRLRKDDDTHPGANSGPPSKKARTLVNGTGLGGTQDDPLVLDELSKDSIISRTSDHSDGSSKSKPVSNISSGAILSAAGSPLSLTHDSNLSPPLSVGIGAKSSAALINKQISSPPNSDLGILNSARITGADEETLEDVPPVQVGSKRGRKRKKKDVYDSESLLREQIAKAQAAGKIRTIDITSREAVDDETSRSSNATAAEETLRRAQLANLSKDEPVIKSEIVEKYLKSQNELKAQMERQYQDAVARNEFSVNEESAVTKNQLKPSTEEGKSKSKKKKDKKRDKKEGSADKVGSSPFPSESEILARLPPIDPEILAEFQNFVYYTNPEPEEENKEPKSEKETENLINKSTSLSSSNQQNNIDEPKKLITTKIDWGDSDDDDDDFEEVKIPEPDEAPRPIEDEEVDKAIAMVVSPVPPDLQDTAAPSINSESIRKPMGVVQVYERPLEEVDESEVERLHTQKIEGLNGNIDKDGQFREWNEVVTTKSYKGDLLHILPYTIIDF